ncbi:adenylate/guanylate cyclase domain-containing protein [Aeromicrobium sp. YIM 150415]|nr:adenylate/guanylate cyclase domain-containing protein [Aeromicrobium sp. YIM 150415]
MVLVSTEDPRGDGHAFDPSLLIDVAAQFLFDGEPTLRQSEVAEAAGVDLDTANALWRHLGFPAVAEDEPGFLPSDVEALRLTERLVELGVLDRDRLPQFVRSTGRTFARLADWHIRVMLAALAADAEGEEEPTSIDAFAEVIPTVEALQGYVWRRHLLAAASRIALGEVASGGDVPVVVGFVDIVGYTAQSRQLNARELGDMVEWFERVTTELVVEHGGQVVKTIGDEAMFVLESAPEAAELGQRLVERAEDDERFPEVRVGMAYGSVVARLGDLFGSTVNLAARLTSAARPGRVLVDDDLAGELQADEERWRLRRARRISVKGYDHLHLWSLKRVEPAN